MSLFAKTACCVLLLCGALEAKAQELVVSSQHTFFNLVLQTRDLACQKASFALLIDNFERIEILDITQSNTWDNPSRGLLFFGFPNSMIKTEQGDVEADIMCIIDPKTNFLVEVSYQFSPSLKGKKSRIAGVSGGTSFLTTAPNRDITAYLQ